MTTAGRGSSQAHRTVNGFFAQPLRDYVLHCLGGPVSLLQAGCLTPLGELTGLLKRVQHVELVLDRLVSALKPGGLLLIRTVDRYSAAGLLGRLLPGPARKALVSRRGELTLPSGPAGLSSSVRITCAAVSRLARGRFGDGHDELLYVIRKPQDRFARVV